jgi:hypothetical protein
MLRKLDIHQRLGLPFFIIHVSPINTIIYYNYIILFTIYEISKITLIALGV